MIRALYDNPVTRAERSYQAGMTLPRGARRFAVLLSLLLIVALITHGALLIAPQVAVLTGVPARDLTEALRGWLGTSAVVIAVLIMFQHLSFAASSVQLSAAAIAREKQARTWESLVLTGVDARRIIVGKWAATLATQWQNYRLLLALRFGIVLWMGLGSYTIELYPSFEPPSIPVVLVFAVVIAVFPLIYAAFMAAVGLLGALLTTGTTAAVRVAMLLYVGSIALSFVLVTMLLVPVASAAAGSWSAMFSPLFVTPLDGGMLTLVGMIAGQGAPSAEYALGMILCVVEYALLALLTLRVAQALAVHQRALPPN